MRNFLLLLSLPVFLTVSCRKGKTLPETVPVYYLPVSQCGLSPAVIYQEPYYSGPYYNAGAGAYTTFNSYIDQYSGYELATAFNEDLSEFCSDNRMPLVSTPTEYELVVNSISIREEAGSEPYFDSCAMAYRNVYLLRLDFSVHAGLYQDGVLVDSWERHAVASEGTRSNRDQCNCPGVRRIRVSPYKLIRRLAKEIRMKTSRAIYDLEGF